MGNMANLQQIKALFLDMDGVLWEGSNPIGDLDRIFRKIAQLGIQPFFGTNNATRTPEMYRDHLTTFGVKIIPEQVITPAVGAVHVFRERFPENPRIHIFGSPALKAFFTAEGFELVDQDADIVLVSLDREMTYQKVQTAMHLIQQGAIFYATNLDTVIASENGFQPGGGVMVKAVQTCTGVEPIVIGKPNPLMIDLIRAKHGLQSNEIMAVGDRYDTDILGGINAGSPTALVLTGVDSEASIRNYKDQPNLICEDLEAVVDTLALSRM